MVILTYNEEANLQQCLNSVSWATELLIVDSGSQDRTLDIAHKNNVRVLQRCAKPFLISEQRNYAMQFGGLTSDWIFFIDADEIVTPELQQYLQDTLRNTPEDIAGFRLTPKFMFLGKWLRHCQPYPSWHDRLARRDKVCFAGGVWEHFEAAEKVGYIHEPYLHFSVSKGIGDWFAKHERYATNEAYDILDTLGEMASSTTGHQRTIRKRRLRDLSARVWPLRPILRFVAMYFLKRGFLDGLPGFLYCVMMASYEFMTILKVIEYRRRAASLPI